MQLLEWSAKNITFAAAMKKLVIISTIVIGVLTSAFAQEATPASNSPIKREAREDMLLMNFNWATILNTGDSVNVKPYSWGYDLMLMYDVPIQSSNFSFAIGGGLGIASYFTNAEIGNINYGTDSAQSYFFPVAEARNIKKNKLTITYADIPFEIRYRSSPDKNGHSWKFAAGAKVGYHVQTKAKIIENSKKVKTYDFPNYEKWRLGITMRVAYGRIGVNAFYSASTIFDDGKGEAINPFSVGITLMPF